VTRADETVADAGLQAERTYLAWQRTGLSFAAVGALLVHAAGGVKHPLSDVPGLIGLAVGAVVLLRGLLRYRLAVEAARGQRSTAAGAAVGGIALAATVLSVAGLVLVLAVG
jgi:uncharacterized membrane protein YidH (DUF202 family)